MYEMKIRFGWITAVVLIAVLASCNGSLLMDPLGTTTLDATSKGLRSIWVVGGLSGNGIATVVPQVDAFDPATGTWSAAVTTLPTPVSFAGVTGYQGKIYVIGGFDSSGVPQNLVQIYDIATDSWSNGIAMTAVRANIDAVAVDGYIYIQGGNATNATAASAGLNTTYRYNIAGDTWDTRTAPGLANSNATMFTYGGSLYMLGGRAGATLRNYNIGYVPDPNLTDLLTTVQETLLTVAKAGFSADVYETDGGTAFCIIAGGATLITGSTLNYVFSGITAFTPTSAVQYLQYPFMAGAAWVTAAQSLPLALGFGDGVIKDSVYYFTGGTNTGTGAAPPNGSDAFYYSNLASFPSNTWQTGPSMPRGRYGHNVVSILEN
jgi:hypothetical protein